MVKNKTFISEHYYHLKITTLSSSNKCLGVKKMSTYKRPVNDDYTLSRRDFFKFAAGAAAVGYGMSKGLGTAYAGTIGAGDEMKDKVKVKFVYNDKDLGQQTIEHDLTRGDLSNLIAGETKEGMPLLLHKTLDNKAGFIIDKDRQTSLNTTGYVLHPSLPGRGIEAYADSLDSSALPTKEVYVVLNPSFKNRDMNPDLLNTSINSESYDDLSNYVAFAAFQVGAQPNIKFNDNSTYSVEWGNLEQRTRQASKPQPVSSQPSRSYGQAAESKAPDEKPEEEEGFFKRLFSLKDNEWRKDQNATGFGGGFGNGPGGNGGSGGATGGTGGQSGGDAF